MKHRCSCDCTYEDHGSRTSILSADRAVLAERVDGQLIARPLSHDHTPFR